MYIVGLMYSDWLRAQEQGRTRVYDDPHREMLRVAGEGAPLARAYEQLASWMTEGYVGAEGLALVGRLVGVSLFDKGGRAWHYGVELSGERNILHVGRHPRYGVHVAVGYVRRCCAWLHVYVTKACKSHPTVVDCGHEEI